MFICLRRSVQMAKKFDIVIFGATGFTGEFVVEEMALTAGNKKWAVAGRSEAKLKQTLEKIGKLTGLNLADIPVIVADVADSDSLARMAKDTKIVVNCVGPYRFHGEVVVKACVENGASHVDISGEPEYLEGMQLKYNEKAKEAGVYIVGACGWDSIPIEMGLNLARQKIDKGELNGAETVASIRAEKGGSVHFGTFQSMIHSFAHRHELKGLRQQLFKEKLPKSPYQLPHRRPLFYFDAVKGWCLPFLGSDKSIVHRTQQYNYFTRKLRPIVVNTYVKVSSLPIAILGMIWGLMFVALASFPLGRTLMEKYPKLFTFGFFSHEGPTREQLSGTSFSYWIFANGWKQKLDDCHEVHSSPPDQKITVRVDGPDPGYFATANCVVTSALTILDDADHLPKEGGVYSPGALFWDTKMIDRLNKRGKIHVAVVEGPTDI